MNLLNTFPVFTEMIRGCCCCSVAKSCLTLCHPMDCSLPGSSAHENFQARILEWFAISYFRGSSWPRDWICISWVSCIGRWFCLLLVPLGGEGNGTPLQYSCLENPMDGGAWYAADYGVPKSRTWLSDFTFTSYFPALEKEMATHSSVLAWKIPGTGEPGGPPSMGSHKVGHNWSDLAAAAAAVPLGKPQCLPLILPFVMYYIY